MFSVLLSGSLVRDPQQRTSANGRPFVTALVRVPAEDADAMLVSAVAFSDSAIQALSALTKGDALAIAGRAKLREWQDAEGRHTGLSVVADQVLSAYAVDKKRRKARAEEEPTGA